MISMMRVRVVQVILVHSLVNKWALIKKMCTSLYTWQTDKKTLHYYWGVDDDHPTFVISAGEAESMTNISGISFLNSFEHSSYQLKNSYIPPLPTTMLSPSAYPSIEKSSSASISNSPASSSSLYSCWTVSCHKSCLS